MKILFSLLLICFAFIARSQPGECLQAYIRDYYIVNISGESIELDVSKINPSGPGELDQSKHTIAAGDSVKVSSIEWAIEYRAPTDFFRFKVSVETQADPNIPSSWKKEELAEGMARYVYSVAGPHR